MVHPAEPRYYGEGSLHYRYHVHLGRADVTGSHPGECSYTGSVPNHPSSSRSGLVGKASALGAENRKFEPCLLDTKL